MSDKRKHNIVCFFARKGGIFISLSFCILSVLVWLGNFYSLSQIGWTSYLGYATLPIFFGNLSFFCFWWIKRSGWLYLSFAGALILFPLVGRFVQVSLDQTSESSIRLLTFNLHGFPDKERKDIIDFVHSYHPDIVCFQEFSSQGEPGIDSVSALLGSELGYKAYYNTDDPQEKIRHLGLILFSRYPVVRFASSYCEKTCNGILWADLKINKDTVRIINVHLYTTGVGMSAHEAYYQSKDSEEFKQKTKEVSHKLERSEEIRLQQVEELLSLIAKTPYKTVIAGDFNSIPVSAVYGKIGSNFQDAFVEKGKGYGYSYNLFRKLLRIDYVFVEQGIKVLRYQSPSNCWSDHNPLVVDLDI